MLQILSIYLSGVLFMLIAGFVTNRYWHSSTKVYAEASLFSWAAVVFVIFYSILKTIEIIIDLIKLEKNMKKFKRWYENT